MYPERLFPHSQEPTIYNEPDQSSLCPPPPFHFLKIHCNIILPSTPGASKWSLYHRLPHPSTVSTSNLPHACYMPHASHSSSFVNTCNLNISSFFVHINRWDWNLNLEIVTFLFFILCIVNWVTNSVSANKCQGVFVGADRVCNWKLKFYVNKN
jgi:hypothetical protein